MATTSSVRITIAHRAALIDILTGRGLGHYSYETRDALVYAGLASYSAGIGEYELTDTGRLVAMEEQTRLAVARARRNRGSRLRADAMRSLGLVRTPYGWE